MDLHTLDLLQGWITGGVQSVICVLGILGNLTTLYILNGQKEMRKQPINLYLTVLTLYDTGVLFFGMLMLCIPSLYRLLSALELLGPDNEIVLHSGPTGIGYANQTIELPSLTLQFNLSEASAAELQYMDDMDTAFNQSAAMVGGLVAAAAGNDSTWLTNSTVGEDMEAESRMPQDPRHLYIHIVYPLALISQTGSIWTTCLVTAERYLAVCHPLRALTLSTRSRAMWALSLLSVGALVYNIPRFYEVELFEVNGTVTIRRSSFRENPVYYYVYYITLNLIMFYVIPLTLLSVLNTKIYMTIRRATRDRSQMSCIEASELNIASMLVLLVAIFIGCNAPAFFVNCLEITDGDSPQFQIAMTFANLLVCFNSSINFIIYCIFGKKFRERLTEVLTCRYMTRTRLKNTSCTAARNNTQIAHSFVGETYV